MPFQTSPEIDFSAVGLITDVPAHAIPAGGWSSCLDVRCKDGSVQGVNAFEDSGILVYPTTANSGDDEINQGKIVAITQFTPAGASDLMLAYIVERNVSSGPKYCSVILYNTSGSGAYEDITNATSSQQFTYNENHPPQIFVFNELLVVNPANDAPPQTTNAKVSAGSLYQLPGWLNDGSGDPIVARIVRPFNNRLVAMDILEEHTSTSTEAATMPIDFLWSSNITTLQSLAAADWSASVTNTAGDAFLTDTPGKIIDGGQLSEFFIAYKSDSVVRVRETGDSYVLAFESIFEDDGLYSTRCFTNIGGSQHLVVGNYGVYIHDGQSQKQDIAKGLFQETLFNLVKPAERNRAFCFQQTRDKEVWFCLSSKSNLSTGCDRAFVYDYTTGRLHLRSLPGISDMFETEFNGELQIYGAKMGDDEIQKLSNTAFVSGGFFEKRDDNFTINGLVKQINRVHVNSTGSLNIAIKGSEKIGETITFTDLAFDPGTTHKVDTRTSGRFISLRVTMDTNVNPKLTTLQFDIKAMGIR